MLYNSFPNDCLSLPNRPMLSKALAMCNTVCTFQAGTCHVQHCLHKSLLLHVHGTGRVTCLRETLSHSNQQAQLHPAFLQVAMTRLSGYSNASTSIMLEDSDDDVEALANYQPSLSSAITLRTPKEPMPVHKPLIIQVRTQYARAVSLCSCSTEHPCTLYTHDARSGAEMQA